MTDSLPAHLMPVEHPSPLTESELLQLQQPTVRPIILVGMMGAGKTTIGRQLAKEMNRKFIDLDHELEARSGVRVSTIFEFEGEQGFRKRESAVLDAVSRLPAIVLATGGGAILSALNRQYLRDRGTVVYLRASTDELFRRVSRDRKRPLLQNQDPRGTLERLLVQREPLYQEVAHLCFETGSASVAHAARRLMVLLKEVSV